MQKLELTRDVMSEKTKHKRLDAVPPDFSLWFRAEILQYGLLPQPPNSKLSFSSLLDLVRKYRHIHEINAKYYSVIASVADDTTTGFTNGSYLTYAALSHSCLFWIKCFFYHYFATHVTSG